MAKKMSMKEKIRAKAKAKKDAAPNFQFNNPDITKETFYKIKEENLFDIIPYIISDPNHPDVLLGQAEIGDEWYTREYKVHFLKDSEGKGKSYICPRTIGKKCPVCAYYTKMIKMGRTTEEMKDFNAKPRELYNVIDKSIPNNNKVQLLDISPHLFGNLLAKNMSVDTVCDQFGNFADVSEGLTLSVNFESASAPGIKKPFLKAFLINFIPRKKQYSPAIIKKAFDLDNIFNVLSYEELETILFNLGDDEVEEYKESLDVGEVQTDEEDIDDEQWDEKEEPEEEPEEEEPEEEPEEEEPEEEEPEEEEPEEDAEEVEDFEEGVCPHGHTFGESCNDFPECQPCPLWITCSDLKDEIEAEQKKEEKKAKPKPKGKPGRKPGKKAGKKK